jgi:hypothetical protein
MSESGQSLPSHDGLKPNNATVTETTLRDVRAAARAIEMQIRILNASTIVEIDAAYRAVVGSMTVSAVQLQPLCHNKDEARAVLRLADELVDWQYGRALRGLKVVS